ncbi:MAG: lactonase family protein [Candidatus Moduliflexus flocculans]|nr:lactonase family protein [Candidatus Moduliflexus flocculans]
MSAYSIDTSTGALTATAGSPFPLGYYYYNSVAVSPTGKFIYVPNSMTDNISARAISPRSGALTAIAGSPFAAGTYPRSVAIDPAGEFAIRGEFGFGQHHRIRHQRLDGSVDGDRRLALPRRIWRRNPSPSIPPAGSPM